MAYGPTQTDVEIRLTGKVRFTDDTEDENKFPRVLLARLIKEAIGKVERDLSPRYAAPFRHEDAGTWDALPTTTKETLRTMFELMAVIRVLGNDFGRGTVNSGGEFKGEQEKLYREMLTREMEQRAGAEGSMGQWRYPPLDSLLTSTQNTQDDGFHGTVIVTTKGDGGFPGKQITDPSEDFSNGVIDE